MATPVPPQLTVELEPGADPIRGRIRRVDGTEQPFWGWLELIDEVSRLATTGTHEEKPT